MLKIASRHFFCGHPLCIQFLTLSNGSVLITQLPVLKGHDNDKYNDMKYANKLDVHRWFFLHDIKEKMTYFIIIIIYGGGKNKPQRSSNQHICASSGRNLRIKKQNESPWKDKKYATKRIKIGQAIWKWEGFEWRGVKWNLGNCLHFGSIFLEAVIALGWRKDRINGKEMGRWWYGLWKTWPGWGTLMLKTFGVNRTSKIAKKLNNYSRSKKNFPSPSQPVFMNLPQFFSPSDAMSYWSWHQIQ